MTNIPDANLIALTPIVNQTELDALNQETLTTAQLTTLNNCLFGTWDTVEVAAGVSGASDAGVAEDRLNSIIELSRRDTTTNAKTRIRMATYYDSSYLNLIKLNHSSDNSLAITSISSLKADGWADGKPDWITFQNRAMMVDGVGDGVGTPDKWWTDGTTVYQLGLSIPATAPTNRGASGTGGYLEDGDYWIKYTYCRSTDYGAESNPVATALKVTFSGATETQKVSVRFTYSEDPQVDRINIYRTKIGATSADTSYYYYEGYIANDSDGGTVDQDVGILEDDSITLLIETDNNRPPDSNYICSAGNRAWYFTQNYGYYSKSAEPEHVPAINEIAFDPDDGEDITNGSTFGNYIMVQKNTKTWVISPYDPDRVNPIKLSSNIGCIAKRSFAVCGNGQIAIWLSQEGFYMSDGQQIKSICEGRIYKDIMDNIDKSEMAATEAIYYPNDMQYICYVPYLNGQYRIWVYSLTNDSWTRYDYPFLPHSVTLFTDENDLKRFIIATFIQGSEEGRRSWWGHFIVADYDHYKDVLYSADCGSTSVTYQNIPITVTTNWNHLGLPEYVQKYFRHMFVEWHADDETTADITVGTDFNAGSETAQEIEHSGTSFPVAEPDNWGDKGHEFTNGWDFGRMKISKVNVPSRTGTWFSVKMEESSTVYVRIYSFVLMFKISAMRSETTG